MHYAASRRRAVRGRADEVGVEDSGEQLHADLRVAIADPVDHADRKIEYGADVFGDGLSATLGRPHLRVRVT